MADVGGALVSGEGPSDTDGAGARMEGGWWIVVPADRKWFARLVIAGAILGTLQQLDLSSPEVSPGHEQELKEIRTTLLGQVLAPGARTKAGAKRR